MQNKDSCAQTNAVPPARAASRCIEWSVILRWRSERLRHSVHTTASSAGFCGFLRDSFIALAKSFWNCSSSLACRSARFFVASLCAETPEQVMLRSSLEMVCLAAQEEYMHCTCMNPHILLCALLEF